MYVRVCVYICIYIYIYIYMLKKLKCSRYRSGIAQRMGRGIALLFHDRGTGRGEWSAARPGRNLPPGKTRYPLYRRLGGPQGRSGRAKYLVPTGIRSQTVQPVVIYIYIYTRARARVYQLLSRSVLRLLYLIYF